MKGKKKYLFSGDIKYLQFIHVEYNYVHVGVWSVVDYFYQLIQLK